MNCPDSTIFVRSGQISKAPKINFVLGKNRTKIGQVKKWRDKVTQTCIVTCHGWSQYVKQRYAGAFADVFESNPREFFGRR